MTAQDRYTLWSLVAGFTIWSVTFVLLYALQALGCAYGWSQHRLVLIVVLVVASLPLAWLATRRPAGTGEPATTLSISALWANRAALAANVLVFLGPATTTSLCI